MSQLLKDKLVILQYATLGRASLADNIDLLAPLISTVGFLLELDHAICITLYPQLNDFPPSQECDQLCP